MLAFVTGATGFLGSHVARVLADQGANLRLLVRSTSNLKNLEGLKAETATGDLRDAASLEKAMAGCDAVFHVAADYRLWLRDPAEMYRSNVAGTRAILEAARKNNVQRVVYTSSVATMGFASNGCPADEDSPVSLADMIGHYKRSKFMAEQLALESGRKGMHVVTVNPTTPVGEQDIKPTPTGRIVVDFLKRKFPAYVETGLNLVDVRECARGHVAAMEKGKSGARYILGGENLTLKQILDKLAAISGLPSPTVKLPSAVAYLAGAVDEMFSGRLLGREPRATVETVRMGKKKMWASSGKAERELGWKQIPVDAALPRAGEWLRSKGYEWDLHCRRPGSRSERLDQRVHARGAGTSRPQVHFLRAERDGSRLRRNWNGGSPPGCRSDHRAVSSGARAVGRVCRSLARGSRCGRYFHACCCGRCQGRQPNKDRRGNGDTGDIYGGRR